MTDRDPASFDFGTDRVAHAYDNVLVPLIFEPWARGLIAALDDWRDRTVLDLAAGTGVVARLLADQVGTGGRIIAADLNHRMLAQAQRRRRTDETRVEFVVSSACPLAVRDAAVDVIACQQGIQFFPDRSGAAAELFRVLRPGGHVLVSAWCPVEECAFFAAVCDALREIDQPDLDAMMRMPFDHLPPDDLEGPFIATGFAEVRLHKHTEALVIPGGPDEVVGAAYATPIGAGLAALPDAQRDAFRDALLRRTATLSPAGESMGTMAAHVLTASRPG